MKNIFHFIQAKIYYFNYLVWYVGDIYLFYWFYNADFGLCFVFSDHKSIVKTNSIQCWDLGIWDKKLTHLDKCI